MGPQPAPLHFWSFVWFFPHGRGPSDWRIDNRGFVCGRTRKEMKPPYQEFWQHLEHSSVCSAKALLLRFCAVSSCTRRLKFVWFSVCSLRMNAIPSSDIAFMRYLRLELHYLCLHIHVLHVPHLVWHALVFYAFFCLFVFMWTLLPMQIGCVHTVLMNFTFLGVAVHYLDEADLPHRLPWCCLPFRRQRIGYCPERSGKSFLEMCLHIRNIWRQAWIYNSCSLKDFCMDR